MSKQFQVDKVGHILVLNFNKIGDTLVQTPLFRALKTSYPHLKISVLASSQATWVLENNPYIDHLTSIDLSPEGSLIDFIKYRRFCQKLILSQNIDCLLCDPISATPKAALLMQLISVDQKIFGAPLNKQFYKFLLYKLIRPEQNLDFYAPILDQMQNLADLFKISEIGSVEVFPSMQEMKKAQDFVSNIRKQGKPIVVFAPFSRQPATQWPLSNIQNLIDQLNREYSTIVIGANNQLDQINKYSNTYLAFDFNLRETFSLAKDCDLLVSLDTGPAHFFTAVKKPLLKINSARIPNQKWGYSGHKDYSSIELSTKCSPCYLSVCPNPNHPCMNQLSPDLVMQKIDTILRGNLAQSPTFLSKLSS